MSFLWQCTRKREMIYRQMIETVPRAGSRYARGIVMGNARYHMNIGGASILLLVTVFALTVFAVLSIRASYNERQMAQKARDAVEHYYAADAKAEEAYALVKKAWEAKPKSTPEMVLAGITLPDGIAAKAQEDGIVLLAGVDNNRTLRVVLHLGDTCQIKEWRLLGDSYGDYGEAADLWDGVFTE